MWSGRTPARCLVQAIRGTSVGGCVILQPTSPAKKVELRPNSTRHLPTTCIIRTPLAASRSPISISTIPSPILFHSPTTPAKSTQPAIMTQDFKKLMPQAKATIHTPVAVEVPGLTKVDGETIPRRNAKIVKDLVVTPSEGVNTLYDVLRYSAKTFGNAKAVGSRKIIDVHTETKKIKKMVDGKETEVDKNWQYYELSPFEYKSFNEFERVCLEIGSALKHLGFGPEDRLHLYAATSAQWLSSAHGESNILPSSCRRVR